ncbi:hypothetical protein [Streptomyces sp. NPDC005805]|uniref:hypothetical protein n=1 Tax=Streptomyces sp. NPDC005805 TaxID=3157068 RepID=UPI0033EA0243
MSRRGTVFHETLTGSLRFGDESVPRPLRLALRVEADHVLRLTGSGTAAVTGIARLAGDGTRYTVSGSMEISPLARRRIRYTLRCDAGPAGAGKGENGFELDGWKSVRPLRPVGSLTELPFSAHGDDGRTGTGTLRFRLATLPAFLLSFRFPRREHPHDGARPDADEGRGSVHARPRWRGEPGRTEVWYTTLTDPRTGTGVWIHHELVAPLDGSKAHTHGWVSVFPPDGPVRHARYGPDPAPHPVKGAPPPRHLTGRAGTWTWDLTERPRGEALFTFPRWAWRTGLLPAAQMLPAARSVYDGTLADGDATALVLDGAPGASARIYGHGNAERWAWLHAELDDVAVLEIVTAVSRRPVLRRLPPLVFLRLRTPDGDWPRRAERSAVGWLGWARFRSDIGLPRWTVTGRSGLRRIEVTVTQPAESTVALEYTDPDGARAVCRNSERADVRVRTERWWGRWRPESEWSLTGTGHAEVGTR